MEAEVKFLGVTYDQRLTWKPHITNVVNRTKKAYHLMRKLSGQKWGASKRALLTVYQALVRSRLDYGAEAFYTASRSQLERLDKVQSKCLRLSCCAFCSTAVNAIQQDCGEMPLSIRRRRQLLRFAVKATGNPSNPASTITSEDWQVAYGKFVPGKEPLCTILQQYRTTEARNNEQLMAPTRLQKPPWLMKKPVTDTKLSETISKKNPLLNA